VCWTVFAVMCAVGPIGMIAVLHDDALPPAGRIAVGVLALLLWWGPFVYAMYLSMAVVKNGDQRLLRHGVRASAVVLSRKRTNEVIQTGGYAWESPSVYKYRLEVSRPGHAAYRTDVRICDSRYAEGSTVTVFVHPRNRKRVAIEPASLTGPGAPGRLRSQRAEAFDVQHAFRATGPFDAGQPEALSRLADLRAQGVLTEAEFAAAKARILNGNG